ncbi:patatin-like phospholipase family protein [Flavitalea flava]
MEKFAGSQLDLAQTPDTPIRPAKKITGKIPDNPLGRIALSCSGGGYRAASFHLGTMSYLHRLGILKNVKLISTVSGGTITGAVYALYNQQGKSLEDVYKFLMDTLSEVDLVTLAVEKLSPAGQWDGPHKRRNLINAFAELYDTYFTKGATMNEFTEMKGDLEAVIFNSTEFTTANNFRFRNLKSGVFGNFNTKVPWELAAEVKVADAIAASSCFTAGFEPIIWPSDFAHSKAEKLVEKAETAASVGLMDGGIYDNQGIGSMLMYRKKQQPYFDLLLISDVTSPVMTAFKPAAVPANNGKDGVTLSELWTKANRWNRLLNRLLIIPPLFFGVLPLFWKYDNIFGTGISVGFAIIFLSIWLGKLCLDKHANKWIAEGKDKATQWLKSGNREFYFNRLKLLKIEDIPLKAIVPLFKDRVSSLGILMLSVFLKVVRRLNYDIIYENDTYQFRRISTLIRGLTQATFKENKAKKVSQVEEMNDDKSSVSIDAVVTEVKAEMKKPDTLKGDYDTVVGKEIKEVAEYAASFGTTLWFTKKQETDDLLEVLVASGQFTMCYNMIEYLESVMFTDGNGYSDLKEDKKEKLITIYKQCLDDWARFKKEPRFLQKEMSDAAKAKK